MRSCSRPMASLAPSSNCRLASVSAMVTNSVAISRLTTTQLRPATLVTQSSAGSASYPFHYPISTTRFQPRCERRDDLPPWLRPELPSGLPARFPNRAKSREGQSSRRPDPPNGTNVNLLGFVFRGTNDVMAETSFLQIFKIVCIDNSPNQGTSHFASEPTALWRRIKVWTTGSCWIRTTIRALAATQ